MKTTQSQLCARKTTKVTGFSRMLKDEVGLTSYALRGIASVLEYSKTPIPHCQDLQEPQPFWPRKTRGVLYASIEPQGCQIAVSASPTAGKASIATTNLIQISYVEKSTVLWAILTTRIARGRPAIPRAPRSPGRLRKMIGDYDRHFSLQSTLSCRRPGA